MLILSTLNPRKSDKSSAQNEHLKPEGNQHLVSGHFDHLPDEGKAGEEVGKETGASDKTTRRDAEYSRAVDALEI